MSILVMMSKVEKMPTLATGGQSCGFQIPLTFLLQYCSVGRIPVKYSVLQASIDHILL